MSDRSPSDRPVIIAGGSGFLGVSLALHLAAAGTSVVLLSRQAPPVNGPWRHVALDARTLGDWQRELDGAAGLVNLVGRTVDCIKTPDHQDEILRSRVEATRVLGHNATAPTNPSHEDRARNGHAVCAGARGRADDIVRTKCIMVRMVTPAWPRDCCGPRGGV
ncbi:MAG: hypothetical protein SGJ11_02485 [Phycisphaerae bacterium]|nr:hypothetical protein [Phycisphaerae bacterium]